MTVWARHIISCLLALPLLAVVGCGGADDPNTASAFQAETGLADPAAVSAVVVAEAAEGMSAEIGVDKEVPVVTGMSVSPPTPGPVQAGASQRSGGHRFLPLDDPRIVLPVEATWLHDDTLILGAVQNGDARAYPVFMMTFHHVANDVLGGEPYLVSF